MNIILSETEQQVKDWQFKDTDNNLEFVSNIVITNKRFIYQKELAGSSTQKSVSRYDIPLENIKSAESFYGEKKSLLWLICGIVGIFLTLFSIVFFVTEEIGLGVSSLIIGLALAVGGIYFHINPDKSPIKLKSPNFSIVLETKNSNGAPFCMGAGKGVTLRGKSAVNPGIFALLFVAGVFPAIAYYVIKKKSANAGLELPEDIAIEIIETLGAVIF